MKTGTSVVTTLADIPALPWAGNFADDSPLIGCVDDYLRYRCTSLKDACLALDLLGKHCFGDDCICTQQDAVDYATAYGWQPLPAWAQGMGA